ncbi:DUF3747 domain-containing protein [Leptolyngbya sp. FACHB-711]|uniref:DUF3747 domain-containing protein n=1 Tax=unclassified Leptolyngbya TaxID=2650499 RepID=UPI0016867D0D|nr:DUF3747 domain-containing protein [Leptolyngbya sp. FACHB-711]MBD1849465.1 DUF3747 domain-containing protein [Cyanobacteria bacterium FACHB-502]MBD2024546.1 DUF3747 domain-containing protein [Leptolyngbya sp. FACHB-711]
MKSTFRRLAAVAAVTTTAVASALTAIPSIAGQFGQKEVDQSKFVAVAAPLQGGSNHQLLVLEQVSSARPCWSESGAAPVVVDPLLVQFDFTGICGRSTDSNGYSIRVNGEDLGLQYSLRVVKKDNDMLLVGASRDRSKPMLLLGQTDGVTNNFAKINLNSGWRFTKRMYGESVLGHVYLTYEGAAVPTIGAVGGGTGAAPVVTPPNPGTGQPTSRFRDTVGDIYLAEIDRAVQVGFISGFEDSTFRPQAELTREQLVSMVLGAIDSLPNVNLNVPAQAGGNPYSDVEASRWSAARIQFAKQNNLISGYEDGTFRPAQPVTRAELMAVLRRAGEYAKSLQGQQPQLQGNRPATAFSDTNGHWANGLISQMSSVCNVASPVNERGTAFSPNSAAQRNYAAAATLRMLNCVNPQQTAAQP